MGDPERLFEEGDMCETEVGGVAGVEDEDVYVVDGVADLGVSGYESEGFTLTQIFRRKRLSNRTVPEGVVDTSHLLQNFSTLQHIQSTFQIEILLASL